jgi:hypothetical protein
MNVDMPQPPEDMGATEEAILTPEEPRPNLGEVAVAGGANPDLCGEPELEVPEPLFVGEKGHETPKTVPDEVSDTVQFTRDEVAAMLAPVFAEEDLSGPPESPFYAVDEEGVTRPRDFAADVTLHPGEIPPSILKDEGMRRGFAFWEEHGSEVQMRVLLIKHEKAGDIERSGVDLRREAQALQKVEGVLYVEGVGMTQDGRDRTSEFFNKVSHASGEQIGELRAYLEAVALEAPQASYETDEAISLIGTGVDVRHVDYSLDGQRRPDAVLTVISDHEERLEIVDAEATVDYTRLGLTHDYYRELYLIGRIGEDLADQLTATGSIPLLTSLLTGALHENVGHRLRTQGVNITFVGGEGLTQGDRDYITCIGKAAMTHEDLVNILMK